MPVTLTIKAVPDAVAEALRQRAQANHRSLQRELLLIAEQAAAVGIPSRVAEPAPRVYTRAARSSRKTVRTAPGAAGRLSLQQLWQRARALGAGEPAESAGIIRNDRDARHRR
jgi:hypothetical protein